MPLFETALTAVGIILILLIGWKVFKHLVAAIIFAVILLAVLWFTGFLSL